MDPRTVIEVGVASQTTFPLGVSGSGSFHGT